MEPKTEYTVEPPPPGKVEVYDARSDAEIIQEAIGYLRKTFTPRQLLRISEALLSIKCGGFGQYHLVFFNGHLDRTETLISSKLPKE
jgi:hypothetical protein